MKAIVYTFVFSYPKGQEAVHQEIVNRPKFIILLPTNSNILNKLHKVQIVNTSKMAHAQ